MIKNVYEILREVEAATTRDQRKQVLLNNNLPHFLQVLKYAYSPKYEFYVKDFPTDYKTPDTVPGIRIAGLESEIRKTYLFLKGDTTADILTEQKRHILLLQLLESFEPDEAKVFINMMNKDLKTKGLTVSLIKETFGETFLD